MTFRKYKLVLGRLHPILLLRFPNFERAPLLQESMANVQVRLFLMVSFEYLANIVESDCNQAAHHYIRDNKVPICSRECKNAYLGHLEEAAHSPIHEVEQRFVDLPLQSPRFLQTELCERLMGDAYMIFKVLCLLTMRPAMDKAAMDVRSPHSRCKILVLDLIERTLHQPGPVLLHAEAYVGLIRRHLCPSLMINGISALTDVLRLSLGVFVGLLRHYWPRLKVECGAFLKEIVLRMLDQRGPTPTQKIILLERLHEICSSSQIMVDLYLNYDCDVQSVDNVFERLVGLLTRTAQVSPHREDLSPQVAKEEVLLSFRALEDLLAVVRSLVDWSKSAADDLKWPFDERVDGEASIRVSSRESLSMPVRPSEEGGGLSSSSAVQLTGTIAEDDPTRTASLQASDDDPRQFRILKDQKRMLATGVTKFNAKPILVRSYDRLEEYALTALGHCLSGRGSTDCVPFSC